VRRGSSRPLWWMHFPSFASLFGRFQERRTISKVAYSGVFSQGVPNVLLFPVDRRRAAASPILHLPHSLLGFRTIWLRLQYEGQHCHGFVLTTNLTWTWWLTWLYRSVECRVLAGLERVESQVPSLRVEIRLVRESGDWVPLSGSHGLFPHLVGGGCSCSLASGDRSCVVNLVQVC